jgi:hypothetical protein
MGTANRDMAIFAAKFVAVTLANKMARTEWALLPLHFAK